MVDVDEVVVEVVVVDVVVEAVVVELVDVVEDLLDFRKGNSAETVLQQARHLPMIISHDPSALLWVPDESEHVWLRRFCLPPKILPALSRVCN